MPAQRNPIRIASNFSSQTLEGGEHGHAGCEDMFGGLAGILSPVGIAPSSLTAHEGGFKLQKQWRGLAVGKAVFIDPTEGPEAIDVELGKVLAYWNFARGNKSSTAVRQLSTNQ